MPAEKAPATKQDYESPPTLIAAVESRFGRLAWDLAAHAGNTKAGGAYFGPGSMHAEDSLAQDWTLLRGTLWLNCEYADIEPWAHKAATSLATVRNDRRRRNRADWRVLLLTPASIGANWFEDYVHDRALVLALRPRMSFVGTTGTDRRDYILSVYGERPGFQLWRWCEGRESR